MSLTDGDVEKIVARLNEKRRAESIEPSDFYIAPEEHYNTHRNLGEMYADWKAIKGAFMKMMVGFILVGTAVMAVIGFVVEFAKDLPSKLLGH